MRNQWLGKNRALIGKKCNLQKNNIQHKHWNYKKQNANYKQVSFAFQQSLFLLTRVIWNTETLLFISSSKDTHWITDTVWQRRTEALSSSWWTVERWYCGPLWNLQWKYGGWLFVWIAARFLFASIWISTVRVVDEVCTEAEWIDTKNNLFWSFVLVQ